MKRRGSVSKSWTWLLLIPLSSLAVAQTVETVCPVYQPLIERLSQDGFDPQFLSNLLLNGRAEPIPSRMNIQIVSEEAPGLYEPFLTAEAILSAKKFLWENGKMLGEVEKGFHVEQEVVVAILLVESRFGENIGKWRVLPILASMAVTDSPDNLQNNYERLLEADPTISYEWVEGVAKKRAQWAYQELKCFIRIIRDEKMDPLEIRGSYAGALGMAQFVPSSYLGFAWSKKGLENWLQSTEEAIFSIANYLRAHGWRKDLALAKKKRILWYYNRSEPYIEAVVNVAQKVKPAPPRKIPKPRRAS